MMRGDIYKSRNSDELIRVLYAKRDGWMPDVCWVSYYFLEGDRRNKFSRSEHRIESFYERHEP